MVVADLLLFEPTFANQLLPRLLHVQILSKIVRDLAARFASRAGRRLPFHAVLGDRDVGKCGDIDLERVGWIVNKLPGLDSSGCATFEIDNVSFVTLNAVALLCGDSGLRFEVERVIERESVELRVGTEGVVSRTQGFAEFGDVLCKVVNLPEAMHYGLLPLAGSWIRHC
ncbi:Metallophosphoesterase protein [Spatholobus suberectus]|nr:Metallophosphoesterase protein [Spatholobus suberectus]